MDGDAEAQARRGGAPGCLDGLRCRPLDRQVQPGREAAEALLDDQRGLRIPRYLSRAPLTVLALFGGMMHRNESFCTEAEQMHNLQSE